MNSTSETTVLGGSSGSNPTSLSPTSTSSIISSTAIPPMITTTSLSYTTITTWPASCDASRSAISSCASSCLSSAAVTQASCGANDIICQCQNQDVIQGAGANCVIGACGFGGAIDVLNSISARTFHLPFHLLIPSWAAALLLFYCERLLSSPEMLLLIICFIQSATASNRGCTPQHFRCSLRPQLQFRQRQLF